MNDAMRTTAHGSPVSHSEATAQLDRILSHPLFENSDRLSRLLRYLVEQDFASRAGEIKEYAIGLDVFDRDASFDPRQDSVVRANATRLRAKLTQYYEGDGKNDPVTIELRRGTYCPVLLRKLPAEAPPALIAIPKRPQPPERGGLWTALAVAGALALALGLGISPRKSPSVVRRSAASVVFRWSRNEENAGLFTGRPNCRI
jgi:hypothetical protein